MALSLLVVSLAVTGLLLFQLIRRYKSAALSIGSFFIIMHKHLG